MGVGRRSAPLNVTNGHATGHEKALITTNHAHPFSWIMSAFDYKSEGTPLDSCCASRRARKAMDMAKAPEPLPPLRTPGYSGAFSQPAFSQPAFSQPAFSQPGVETAKQVWDI